MSLSAEYCNDKTGDRGGGGGAALVHQRRLIRVLLVWATLLTLGLGTSITLHIIRRDAPTPSALQNQENDNHPPSYNHPLMEFLPDWKDTDMVDLLQWKTLRPLFISGSNQLLVNEFGHYFLYLKVTLASHEKANHTIIVKSKKRDVILKGLINGSKLSSVLMAKGFSLDSGDTLTVTCQPKAKIQSAHTETYLGVIKLNST
ncbi:tumor necrosis factor ligand superfamily member 18 isoform X2 [Puntigrus tetrazona]|uniref:tumor necrosis factor ligand superfamily member 18 isoform X2 n=1 Tax=Puntigrus tetrazona TaxID=1606681 RepID=UPI001C8999EE|nr:tumor necrosis factor ligand superfamily member 18 isoform X2 [Puntigrus tetrazona]